MQKEYTPEELSKLLVLCAQDKMDAEKITKDLAHLKFNNDVINSAIHFLHHFYADADLRSRDAEYDKHMRNKLLSYASQLMNSDE